MAKYKVVIVTNNADIRLALRQNLGREEEIALLGFVAMDSSVLTKIAGYAPHVALFVQDREDTGVLDMAERVLHAVQGCALVLLAHDVDLPKMRAAMQAGFRLVVDMQDMGRLKESLVQAATLEQGRVVEGVRQPHVISVYGGKGGSGKTTIAVNLAAALTQAGYRTALIDLCLIYGDAALLLNIQAKDTIAELVQEKNIFTIEDIKSFCMQHLSGLHVLCAPASPELAEYVTPRHVETLVSLMRPYYDFIILDLPCDLTECTLTAMDNSDNILLLTRPDISGLRAAKMTMGILRTLQMEDKVLLLINADRKAIVRQRDFEQVLELPVTFRIPEDPKTAELGQQRGVPFVLDIPRAPISLEIKKLAGYWQRTNERRTEGRRTRK